jgi:hypothetical protein
MPLFLIGYSLLPFTPKDMAVSERCRLHTARAGLGLHSSDQGAFHRFFFGAELAGISIRDLHCLLVSDTGSFLTSWSPVRSEVDRVVADPVGP